jgi:hypothetical protein
MSPKSIFQRNADPFVGTVRHPFTKKATPKKYFYKGIDVVILLSDTSYVVCFFTKGKRNEPRL